MGSELYKFNIGDIVYEITTPQQLMMVTRRNGNLYYCQYIDGRIKKPTAVMERDLKGFHKAEVSEIDNKSLTNKNPLINLP